MKWLEVSVCADDEAAEAISELFGRYGAGGAAIEQYPPDVKREDPCPSDWNNLVKTYLDTAEEAALQRLEEALWHLRQIYPFGPMRTKLLEEEDWATAWQADYQVQRIGQRIVVVPSWLEHEPDPEDHVLHIDPGMAFGTGLHPSTRLCLIALERVPLEGKSLLDVGTGSGILSILAAQRGASPIVALDTDTIAVKTAEENLRLNNVHGVSLGVGSISLSGWDLSQGDATDYPPKPFDVIVINILAEVIAMLTPALADFLADNGCIIAAGIIAEREQVVLKAWHDAGIEIVERNQEGDWVSLIGVPA
jgi:ribosomal protein L11 methyltransferase